MNKIKKVNNQILPFTTEHFLKAVDDSSKRSRSILLLLTFSSLLVFMALINSFQPEFNWFKSKIEVNKDILKFIVLPDKKNDSTKKSQGQTLSSLSDYVFYNEKLNNNKNTDEYIKNESRKYDSKYSKINFIQIKNPSIAPIYGETYEERKAKYDELNNAIEYVYKHNIIEQETLKHFINKLDEAQVEHLEIIRVPILGISFYVNYLGIYSGLILAVLYILLYFSLSREKTNLEITFKRGWSEMKHHHYYLYEYVSMLQVLSIPKKLFRPEKGKHFSYTLFAYLGIVLPFLIYFLVFSYDIKTSNIGNETNSTMTYLTLGLSGICFSIILFYTCKVCILWYEMDLLWDNQAYEFNIEYILEAIDEDEDKDLIADGVYAPMITKNDKNEVKYLWYSILQHEFKKNKKSYLTSTRPIYILDKFIRKVFNREFVKNKENIPLDKLDEYWNPLKIWFNQFGKKNVTSHFRITFKQMVVLLMKKS